MEKARAKPFSPILVVDDDDEVHAVTRFVLGRTEILGRPLDLIEARSLRQAQDMLLTHADIAVILLDVVMPKMDGFEVCRVLRGIEATRGIKIIMVTTRGEGKNVEAGFASGCDDYVTKPINHRELLSKIQRHIGGSEAT